MSESFDFCGMRVVVNPLLAEGHWAMVDHAGNVVAFGTPQYSYTIPDGEPPASMLVSESAWPEILKRAMLIRDADAGRAALSEGGENG